MAVIPQQVLSDEEMRRVEEVIRRTVTSDVPLISQICAHVMGAGGKRLRPRVLLLAYKAVGGKNISEAVPLAATVELLHTASLIHDDINDHSATRRGQVSVNALLGDSLALLIGDFIFIKLLSHMASLSPRSIRVLADACRDIVEGETLQMLNMGNIEMTEEIYLKIVTQKTASLFAASAELGALIGGGTEEQIRVLAEYGLHLGVTFQIRDDTLDLIGDPHVLGKPVAGDIGQGKYGLAVLYGLRVGDCLAKSLEQKDIQTVLCLLEESGALDYADRRAQEYAKAARSALSRLPVSSARSALEELADWAARRDS